MSGHWGGKARELGAFVMAKDGHVYICVSCLPYIKLTLLAGCLNHVVKLKFNHIREAIQVYFDLFLLLDNIEKGVFEWLPSTNNVLIILL